MFMANYKFNAIDFPKDPIGKRWNRQRIGTTGNRVPVFADIWQLELNFPTLETQGQSDYFESRFFAETLYNATLPHPISGDFTIFTGTSIEEYTYEFADIGNTTREFYAWNARLVLSVDIRATGT